MESSTSSATRVPSHVEPNNPNRAGQRASQPVAFGPFNRFRVYAIHTRFEAVEWFATDAEQVDDVTGGPAVVAQEATFNRAVAVALRSLEARS